jgi:hypothetical protein
MKKLIVTVVLVVVVIVAVLIYVYPAFISQTSTKQDITVPPTSDAFKPRKGLPPIILLDHPKIEKFLSDGAARAGIPAKAIHSSELTQDGNAANKIETVLSRVALPILHGRTYGGILGLDEHCAPPEPCKRRVMAPSQVNWSVDDTTSFKRQIGDVIRELPTPVRDDDRVVEITWITTDTNERFTTYLVTSKDGTPKFESMLWFSPVEKQCGEKPDLRPQETSLEWNGYVKNGFGMEVVTWTGKATYRYQNGKLLPPPPCPDRSCLNVDSKTLWQVDLDATTVKTAPVVNAQPEEETLTYQIVWSVGFPKSTVTNFSLELPPPKGNAIAGSFALRGDGTWNKIN